MELACFEKKRYWARDYLHRRLTVTLEPLMLKALLHVLLIDVL